MTGNWIALITLGCFCILASYSWGAGQHKGYASAQPTRIAKPVIITAQDSHNCGDNWLCVIQWSTEYHPPKRKH